MQRAQPEGKSRGLHNMEACRSSRWLHWLRGPCQAIMIPTGTNHVFEPHVGCKGEECRAASGHAARSPNKSGSWNTGPQVRLGLVAVSRKPRANYRAWTLGSTAVRCWPRARQAIMRSRHQGCRPGSKAGAVQADLPAAPPMPPEGASSHPALLTTSKSLQPCTRKWGYDLSHLRGPSWMLHFHSHEHIRFLGVEQQFWGVMQEGCRCRATWPACQEKLGWGRG